MKKSFFMLPIAISVLAACSSTSPAPVEEANNALPAGMMRAVDNNLSTTWEPQIQKQNMPASMVTPQPHQTYQTYQGNAQQLQQNQPVVAMEKVSQDFVIPRNPQTNAPDYSKINKGFYKGSTYTVRKGDTMFLIAYICGLDVKELATMNHMSEPYNLSVGQVLKVSNKIATASTTQTTQSTYNQRSNNSSYISEPSITMPTQMNNQVQEKVKSSVPVITKTQQTTGVNNIAWRWPTRGNIVQSFSNADGGNKGIDISGSRGQAINSAAAGRVVYAGNALRGYGNLIIIKHNDDFLSAYAHNESILVKDQQEVKAGQQIAKMGSSGTNSVKLHFEIRYKGKSVDPVNYLPRR
ncbi:peptidoglycan DD-metalloendopeptidase family protein [Avibacterium paragallinarum]|uniref:peptidoglycan DD-metalloendopeptidase family protein n=1 Tax=Avibacterium paragallinarum TaxID=728 RepID=UPI00397ADBCC